MNEKLGRWESVWEGFDRIVRDQNDEKTLTPICVVSYHLFRDTNCNTKVARAMLNLAHGATKSCHRTVSVSKVCNKQLLNKEYHQRYSIVNLLRRARHHRYSNLKKTFS